MVLSFSELNDTVLLEYAPYSGHEALFARLGVEFKGGDLVKYTSDSIPGELKSYWPPLQEDCSIVVKRVFHFGQDDLVEAETDEDTLAFCFARIGCGDRSEYWHVEGRVFGIAQDVFIAKGIRLTRDLFCVGYERRTSVMAKIAKLLSLDEREIVIGGGADNAIPEEDYLELVHRFPTTRELERYGQSVVESYLHDYLVFAKDFSGDYHKRYGARRRDVLNGLTLRLPELDGSRRETFNETRVILADLLARDDAVHDVDESVWQGHVLKVIPTLFPQYVSVISKARVKDVLHSSWREIDFLLVDASGNVDVLEIKRAFSKHNLIMRKEYRGNYVPAKELSGGVVQIEKYIHYLLNWGPEGERLLTEKYAKDLPSGLNLRFLNPRGLLLMGHCDFSAEEQRDFDIIRRQYAHVVDVITYDDLLARLDRMIEMVS